jgi:hypothetical protein
MKKEKLSIPFKIADIETKQWAITPENFDNNSSNIELKFNSGFSIDLEHNIINSLPKITLLQNDKQFIIIETDFSFLIEKNGWEKMIHNEKLTIPKPLKEHFLVIAIGTIRGIILEKTSSKESSIKSFVLPAIDVRNGSGEDLVFELNKEQN